MDVSDVQLKVLTLSRQFIATIGTFEATRFFFLQGKAPKKIHTIITETLACFLPGRAKDLEHPCSYVVYTTKRNFISYGSLSTKSLLLKHNVSETVFKNICGSGSNCYDSREALGSKLGRDID